MYSKIITSFFINLLLVVSVFADIEVEVYHKKPVNDYPNDNQVMPHIKIENTGSDTITLSNITAEYYIYETGLSVSDLTWRYDWCNFGNIFNVQFFNLDEPYTEGDKKANMKFLITFTSNTKLLNGQAVILHIAVYKNDWSHNFSEAEHWSYAQNTSYTLNGSIVIRDVSGGGGVIIYGTPPPTEQARQIPYPENCGQGDSMQIDGSVFLNPGVNGHDTIQLANTYDPRKDLDVFTVTAPGGMSVITFAGETWLVDDQGMRTSGDSLRIFSDIVNGNYINAGAEITSPYIRTSELRVTDSLFPDYVFSDENYQLKSLSEIEEYINQHKRLPGMPSEQEVKTNGRNVGEVQLKLVEKIEEMTLHLIKLEKRIRELENAE